MHLIEPADYPRIALLFRDMEQHLAAVAALQGSIPAEIYADDGIGADEAHVGLISVNANHRRLYLVARGPLGDSAHDVSALMAKTLARAHAAGVETFSLAYTPAAWGTILDAVLPESRMPDRHPIHVVRQSYEFRTLRQGRRLPDWRSTLPRGFTLRQADRELLEDSRVTGLGALSEEMRSERSSVDDFLAHSFGICPVHESGALAGWCLSEYNSGDRCEVGIASLPPYQRLGLATAVGSAFVKLAASRGVTRIGWHCHAGNTASAATALSIGFEKIEDYPATIAWY